MARGKAWNKEAVIATLKPFFMLGYGTAKACEIAGIDYTVVFRWLKKNPELAMQVKAWQNSINTKARDVVARSIIKGDDKGREDAKWWLERRERKSFSTKQVIGGEGDKGEIIFKFTNYGGNNSSVQLPAKTVSDTVPKRLPEKRSK